MNDVVYRYVGQPSQHYHGVPARDLTAADVAALTDEQRAAVVTGQLYQAVAPAFDGDPDTGVATSEDGTVVAVRKGRVR